MRTARVILPLSNRRRREHLAQSAAHPEHRRRYRQLERIRARILVAGGVLFAMVVLGVAGFYSIGPPGTSWSDALYMTLITLSTVGYAEVVPIVGVWDRLFTGIISLVGFGSVTFMFTSLSVFFLERDLDETLRRRRMEKQIGKLRQHYVVCGFGRVGRNVTLELAATRRQFVVIELEERVFEAARERLPDVLALCGDASDDDVLVTANIAHAAGVFAITDEDSRNLMITLTAKQLNPGVRVVARCHEIRNTPKLRQAGADVVVSPDFTGGMRIASSMIRPQVVSFLDEMLRSEGSFRVEEVHLPRGFVPCPLDALELAQMDVVLLGIRQRDGFVFNPDADFSLVPGQVLVVMCRPEAREALERAVTP